MDTTSGGHMTSDEARGAAMVAAADWSHEVGEFQARDFNDYLGEPAASYKRLGEVITFYGDVRVLEALRELQGCLIDDYCGSTTDGGVSWKCAKHKEIAAIEQRIAKEG